MYIPAVVTHPPGTQTLHLSGTNLQQPTQTDENTIFSKATSTTPVTNTASKSSKSTSQPTESHKPQKNYGQLKIPRSVGGIAIGGLGKYQFNRTNANHINYKLYNISTTRIFFISFRIGESSIFGCSVWRSSITLSNFVSIAACLIIK